MIISLLFQRTAVGLARCHGVDQRWFLKVPLPNYVSEGDIIEMFRDVLIQLPSTESVHKCTKTLTASALEQYLSYSDDQTMDSDIR